MNKPTGIKCIKISREKGLSIVSSLPLQIIKWISLLTKYEVIQRGTNDKCAIRNSLTLNLNPKNFLGVLKVSKLLVEINQIVKYLFPKRMQLVCPEECVRGNITHQRNFILNLIKIECTFIFFCKMQCLTIRMNIDKYSHVCGGVPGRRLNVKPGVSPTTQVVSRLWQGVSWVSQQIHQRSSGSCPRQGLAQIHSGRQAVSQPSLHLGHGAFVSTYRMVHVLQLL